MRAAWAQGLQWMMMTFSRDLIGQAADLWFIFNLEHNPLCSTVIWWWFEVTQLCFSVNSMWDILSYVCVCARACAPGTNQISARTTLGLSGDSRSDSVSTKDSCFMHIFKSSTVIFWELDLTMSLKVFILSRASFCVCVCGGKPENWWHDAKKNKKTNIRAQRF